MSYPKKKSLWTILFSCGLFLVALSSCQKDFIDPMIIEDPVVEAGPKSYPGVDEALWSYFERFEIEAAAQNIEIDLIQTETTGTIEDLEEENVAGLCSYSTDRQNQIIENHITIDMEFWNRFNDNVKEMIVFHELGHCVLGRGHREGQLQNGSCISIMRSGSEFCRDVYNPSTKAYYISELFHPERAD